MTQLETPPGEGEQEQELQKKEKEELQKNLWMREIEVSDLQALIQKKNREILHYKIMYHKEKDRRKRVEDML